MMVNDGQQAAPYRRKTNMNVKSVEKENGKAKVTVEIDKAEFELALNKAYAKCRKNIMIPGFRKGKAPRKMVESMYGATVFYEDAVNEIFPEIYAKAVTEQELNAVGAPSITDMDTPEEGGVVLTVETALYPEVTLGQYKGVEAPKTEVKVEESDVEAELSRMAERNARIETVERAAKMGDTVVLDFEGFENGVAFSGGKAENYSLTLGSGSFIPGFEEALVGVSAGEQKQVNVTFPENYSKDLAGKPAVFECKIHEVKESVKPELDDEFAKDVSEFDTLEALKDDIRARFTKNRQESAERAFESAAVQVAASNMTCEIPACMIDEQVDRQIEQFSYQLQSQGMKMEDYAKMIGGDMNGVRESMRPMAEMTVRSNILLSAVVKEEGIEVSDDEIEEELKNIAAQYQMELEQVKAAVDMAAVKADLAGRKAAKLIAENAVATEKTEAPAEQAAEEAETAEKE